MQSHQRAGQTVREPVEVRAQVHTFPLFGLFIAALRCWMSHYSQKRHRSHQSIFKPDIFSLFYIYPKLNRSSVKHQQKSPSEGLLRRDNKNCHWLIWIPSIVSGHVCANYATVGVKWQTARTTREEAALGTVAPLRSLDRWRNFLSKRQRLWPCGAPSLDSDATSLSCETAVSVVRLLRYTNWQNVLLLAAYQACYD